MIRNRNLLVMLAAAIQFSGCFSTVEPLPPREALLAADERVTILMQEEREFRGRPIEMESPQSAEDPSRVDLWYYSHPIVGPVVGSPARVASFNKAQGDINLNCLFIGDWHLAIQKLTVCLAAGDLPDIAVVERSWAARLADAGRIMPLDGYITPGLFNDIDPKARDALTKDGLLYALPADGFCSALFFNRDAIGGAPPRTWADLKAIGAKTAGASDTPVVLGDLPFVETLWSADGSVGERMDSGLGSTQAVESIEFLISLRDAGVLSPATLGYPDIAFAAFQGGRVAMTVASTQLLPKVQACEFPVGFAPVPGRDGPVSRVGESAIVVFARHATAKRDAIVKVLDFLTGPDVQGEDAAAIGSMPTRVSVSSRVSLPDGLKQCWDSSRSTPFAGSWAAIEFELTRHLGLAYRWKGDGE